MRRRAFHRLIGSGEAAQQTPDHDQITQLQRLLLCVTGHIDLSLTNFHFQVAEVGHLSHGWSVGVRRCISSKAEQGIADENASVSVGSPGSVVDKDSGEISRGESGSRNARQFSQCNGTAGFRNGIYRRRMCWPAATGTALPPHSTARRPDAEQALAAPNGRWGHLKGVVTAQPTALAATMEAPGATRPMSELQHQVQQPGARIFNQPWTQSQDPLSAQRHTDLRTDVTEWQTGLSARRLFATRPLPGQQGGSQRTPGPPTDTSATFTKAVPSSPSESSPSWPPSSPRKSTLARLNSYTTLQAALVAMERGAPPPSVGELGWLLETWRFEQERASRGKSGSAESGEAAWKSREVSERLERLLLPHLQGPYGISLTPGKLTQLFWAMVKGGHMGASAAAVLDALDRTVHPGLPYTKSDYWATLALWTLGRAQQMAKGAGGAGAPAASAGGGSAASSGGFASVRRSRAVAAAALVAHARAGVLPKLVDVVCRNVEVINGQGLANFFWAAGQLKFRDIQALATVGARLHRDFRMLDSQNIANILYGTALLELDKKARAAIQQQAPFLLTLVEEAARRGLQGFNPQEISNLVWASSKLDLNNRLLLENAAKIIAETNYHERAVAQEWANTLYGMALKDFYDPRVFEKLEMALLPPEQWRMRPGEEPAAAPRDQGPALRPSRSPAAVPSFVARVEMAVDGPVNDDAAMTTESSRRSSGCGGSGRSRANGSVTALYGIGSSAVKDGPSAETVSSSPENPPQALDPGFGPTITAAADANCGPGTELAPEACFPHPAAQWSSHVPITTPTIPATPAIAASTTSYTSKRLLSGATPQTCSNILYAMGLLRHLDERLVDIILGRLVTHGSGSGLQVLSSTDIALTVRACAQLGYRPPLLSDFLDRAMPRLQADRHRLMAHNLLWALLVLDMLPEPRHQPLVQLLVAAVNRHGISAWAPSSPAMARKNNPYASPGPSASVSGAAVGPLTAKAGSEAAASAAAAVKAALQAEQVRQEHRKRRHADQGHGPGSGEEGVVVAGSWWEDVMEDWSQLLQYHIESRRLGLTGPLYDITASFLPGGMEELERAVRAHRRLVSERQRSLVVQRRVQDMLHQMAVDRDPSHPAILHIESEVILDPEATTVDIVVHLARPGTTTASVSAAAGRSTVEAVDAAAMAAASDAAVAVRGDATAVDAKVRTAPPTAAAAVQKVEDAEDASGDAGPGAVLPQRSLGPAAERDLGGGLQRHKHNGDGDFRPVPTIPPSSPPGPPPPYLSYKVAIEVDGPWHYMRNRPTMADGTTLNRNRTLERHMGPDNVLVVRTRHWVQRLRSEDERRRYLAELLRATGPRPLQPPASASRDPSPVEPLLSKA